MACVANHDTTDSRAFPADLCSFRDLIGDCSMVAMPPVLHTGILLGYMATATSVQRFRTGASTFYDRLRVAPEQVPGSMFRVRPILSKKFAPQVDFDPTVLRTQCGVSEIVMEFSHVWRSMTCLCQQEILDKMLSAAETCQEDISTCGPTPVRPLLFLVLESTKFFCHVLMHVHQE